MGKEEQLLEGWRELTPEKQQKVLEFVEALKSESDATPIITEYTPQTPLVHVTVKGVRKYRGLMLGFTTFHPTYE